MGKKHTTAVISERRQKLWTCLTKGMKTYEIAKELGTDHSTISRDIKYLTAQSQNYLNSLAKETLPFMYQTSIEGIRGIIKECWTIYDSSSKHVSKASSTQANQRVPRSSISLSRPTVTFPGLINTLYYLVVCIRPLYYI